MTYALRSRTDLVCISCRENPIIWPVICCWYCRQSGGHRSGVHRWYEPEVVEEAVRLYVEEKLSCRLVEIEMRGYRPAPSQQAVYTWVKWLGVCRTRSEADVVQNGRRNGIDYEALGPRARELYKTRKWSPKRIGMELGVTAKVIIRLLGSEYVPDPTEALRRACWEADTPGVRARWSRRKLTVEMKFQGATYAEIMKVTGLSGATVFKYCKVAGLVAEQDYPEDLQGTIRQLHRLQRLIRNRSGKNNNPRLPARYKKRRPHAQDTNDGGRPRAAVSSGGEAPERQRRRPGPRIGESPRDRRPGQCHR